MGFAQSVEYISMFSDLSTLFPGGIFPMLPGREEVMQKLRERMLAAAGTLPPMPTPQSNPAFNLAALFASTFPRVDASGMLMHLHVFFICISKFAISC